MRIKKGPVKPTPAPPKAPSVPKGPRSGPPPSPQKELERMVNAVNARRDERVAAEVERRRERSGAATAARVGRAAPAPPKAYVPALRAERPTGIAPFYGQGAPPIPSRPEILGNYPWSAYGSGMVGKTPFLTEGTLGALAVPAGIRKGATGAVPGVKFALPSTRGLPMPAAVYAKQGGVTIPHELSHINQLGTWTEEDEEAFGKELLAWLAAKPVEEWDQDRLYAYDKFVGSGENMVEAYAYLGERPELIPSELEAWYPQYDLTRRRAMGVPQRPGYGGPAAVSPSVATSAKGPGLRTTVRGGGPVEQFMERSIYPAFDRFGQQVPFWSPLASVGETGRGQDYWKYVDYWNELMAGPRRVLRG